MWEQLFIREAESNDTGLSIVKQYNSRRRYILSRLFILWTLLWTIFSKSALYKHNYNKRKYLGICDAWHFKRVAVLPVYSESVLAAASVCWLILRYALIRLPTMTLVGVRAFHPYLCFSQVVTVGAIRLSYKSAMWQLHKNLCLRLHTTVTSLAIAIIHSVFANI